MGAAKTALFQLHFFYKCQPCVDTVLERSERDELMAEASGLNPVSHICNNVLRKVFCEVDFTKYIIQIYIFSILSRAHRTRRLEFF